VATTTTTPTRLFHLFQILHSENSKRFSILLELKQNHSPFRKFKKVFNSFGSQTDSSPFGKFKKFSIPLELKLET
jgi:hypothetical protein